MGRRTNRAQVLKAGVGVSLLALALALLFSPALGAALPEQTVTVTATASGTATPLTPIIAPTPTPTATSTATALQEGARTPVIILLKEPVRAEHAQAIQALGGVIKYRYTIIKGIAASVPELARLAIAQLPFVEKVEPDSQARALEDTLPWGVDRIDADLVHSYNKGTGVRIAIIDTGTDYTHPDLGGCLGATCKVKGGWDFVNNDNNPMDDNGHGTWVAGVTAAVDNEIGVIGVAPEASLYALKVLNASGSGDISDIIAAIEWAVKGSDGVAGNADDADIINMSLGYDGPFFLSSLKDACDTAYAAGLLLVAAAGNHGPGDPDDVEQPAEYDSVIAVSATNSDDSLASYSDYGPEVELAAPGTSIYSTWPGNAYNTGSGTSGAAPHVSGVAALIWHGEPSLTNVQVRQRLQQTAIGLGAAGRDQYFGYGLVYARNAAPPAISITVSPSSVAYGAVALSPSASSPVTKQSGAITITNNSSVAVNLSIYGSNATAPGNTWTLVWSSATVGYDAYMHKFAIPTDANYADGPFTRELTKTAQTLKEGVAVETGQEFKLEIYMPTGTGSSEQHSTLVTIVATSPP